MFLSMFVPVGVVPDLKLFCQVFNPQSLAGEQDNEVVEHVCSFVDQAFVAAIGGLNHQFQCFLANLLCHAVEAVAEKACRITPFGHLLVALFDEVL